VHWGRQLEAVASGNGAKGGVRRPGAAADDLDAFGVVDRDVSRPVLAGEAEIDAAATDTEAADMDAVKPVGETWPDDVQAAAGCVRDEAEDRLKDLKDRAGSPGLGPAGDRVGHRRFAQGPGLTAE